MQWRVVILSWVTYAVYYLGRVNLAGALPTVEAEFGWTAEQTGILVSASLWTYAAGQLVNGWLGQQVNARRLVLAGLVGSSVLNLLFALVAGPTALPLLLMLWLVNGFFQAMGWGPILRTLSETLTTAQRRRISGLFGASYVVGSAATWLLTGLLLSSGQWRLAFAVPALLMTAMGVVWYSLSPRAGTSGEAGRVLRLADVRSMLRQILPVTLTALIAGALINGALFFAPSFAAEQLPLDQAAFVAVIFPICGLIGTAWLGGKVLERFGDPLVSLTALLALSALARGLHFVLPPSTATSVILLAAMGITSYALTNVLLTAVPLITYAHLGTSMVAGVLDATHSVGGAIGGTVVGFMIARGGWTWVFLLWTVLPLIAIGFVSAVRYRQFVQASRT